MSFPEHRPRRLRRTPLLRDLIRETRLDARDLVAPLFVKEGISEPEPIASMPGVVQHTLDSLRKQGATLREAGVPAVIVFGIPADKDARGTQAAASQGISQQGLRALREELGEDIVLFADLCLCEYTDHAHCGVVRPDGVVDNDATLEIYAATAVAQAEAGADLVAPSGMQDGQVGAIRSALDAAGHQDVGILAYSAKFASSFYGPFRDAAECAPAFGDRTQYQMDPGNLEEAVREMQADLDEGADILMVKPALPYLDVLRVGKDATGAPMAAYCVSGEYAMLKAAASNGWLDERRTVLESLLAIRRAGADLVLTYHALDAARWLADD